MLPKGSNTNSKGITAPRVPNANSLVLLANIEDRHIVDVPGDGSQSSDKTVADDIEQQALAIPAPTKSLNSPADGVGVWFLALYTLLIVWGLVQKKKVHIQNCQTWLRQLVEDLSKPKYSPILPSPC
jgi:hypothetical protein